MSEDPTALSDSYIYVRDLLLEGLHVGVEEALKLALRCFRQELWVPAVAMLGAASERAWIEAGTAIAGAMTTPAGNKLRESLENANVSIRRKIAAISDAYTHLTS